MPPETQATATAVERRPLPSRFALPLVGDTLAFARDAGGFLAKRAGELGPVFEIHVFGHPTACFVGPEAFALILDDRNVERTSANPPHIEAIFNPRSVPFLDGPTQRRRKRLLLQAFSQSALDGYLPIIERVVARYVQRWQEKAHFSWVPELNSLGFSIAGALFVGSDPARDDSEIEEAFGKVAAGLLSVPVNLPFTRYGQALKARDYLLTIVDRALDAGERATFGGTNVLGRLQQARDGDDKLGRDELRIETFHFFGAYSAVIGGLSFLVSALGRFPEAAIRARAEVLREAPSGPLTLASLRKLEYLERFTKEVRRAMPILPLTFFGRVKREMIFQDVRIPVGHRAIGCIGATLLDPRTFPDPDRFDPDRWLNPSEQQKRAWVPHGGGNPADGHRCAGEALAQLMMQALGVHLLRSSEWTFDPGQSFAPTKAKLFATPVDGLRVRFSRR
jgi:cytochrome P450